MKLIHIVTAKVWGGGETYVYNLCKGEKDLGTENIIILDYKGAGLAERFSQVAQVKIMGLRGLNKFFAARKLIKLSKKEAVSAVVAHSGAAGLTLGVVKSLDPSIKTVMFRHNILRNKTDIYHSWLISKIDGFICVSQKVLDKQLEGLSSALSHKFKLIYTGIPISSYESLLVKPSEGPFIVGYAGRLIENKGILDLLEALALCKAEGLLIELHYCGAVEGIFDQVITEKIKNLHLNDCVFYEGYISNVEEFYKSLHVLVLPSQVAEAFGLTLIEAMSCGTAVITTNSGAQVEIITHGVNGLIVDAYSPAQLCDAIVALYKNRNCLQSMGVLAQKTVNQYFRLEIMVNNINKFISHL